MIFKSGNGNSHFRSFKLNFFRQSQQILKYILDYCPNEKASVFQFCSLGRLYQICSQNLLTFYGIFSSVYPWLVPLAVTKPQSRIFPSLFLSLGIAFSISSNAAPLFTLPKTSLGNCGIRAPLFPYLSTAHPKNNLWLIQMLLFIL